MRNVARISHGVANRSLFALLLTFGIFACAQHDNSPQPGGGGQILRVHVKADGTILANGKPTSLEGLKQQFKSLASAGGTVCYSRDNPTGEPPPNAMAVMEAIVEAKLPVQLAESGDA